MKKIAIALLLCTMSSSAYAHLSKVLKEEIFNEVMSAGFPAMFHRLPDTVQSSLIFDIKHNLGMQFCVSGYRMNLEETIHYAILESNAQSKKEFQLAEYFKNKMVREGLYARMQKAYCGGVERKIIYRALGLDLYLEN